MTSIHQFIPMLHRGDAVGGHTLAVRDTLRARGYTSEIYVEHEDPETAHESLPVLECGQGGPGDVLVYQLATSSAMASWLLRRPEPLVVNYHNITPSEQFGPWDNGLALHQALARVEVGMLAGRASLGVAVSEYNRADLVATGYVETAVVPPVVSLAGDGRGASAADSTDGADGDAPVPDRRPARTTGARWLTVGRLAPNKAIEDVVAGLFAVRALHDPEATLTVVGRPALPVYAAAVREFVAELGLSDAVRFAGRVDDDRLVELYRESDVLVVASEHEGFCLPLVEAMAHDLPVVALREGAVAEVLGEAGVLLESKDPLTLAEAATRLQLDDEWRSGVVEAGRRRLPDLGLAGAADRLVDLLVGVSR